MDIILNDKKPKYLQIFDNIKEMINSNKLKANEKLPSKRALALVGSPQRLTTSVGRNHCGFTHTSIFPVALS